MPPRGYDEDVLAQDFFSDDVGRILAFDGSMVLAKGNDVLREVIERFPDSRAALHARIPLGNAVAVPRKRLNLADGIQPAMPVYKANGGIVEVPADDEQARRQLSSVLVGESNVAAETLGHVDYKEYGVAFADWLAQRGDVKDAAGVLTDLYQTLLRRKVLPRVLEEIKRRHDEYKTLQSGPKSPRGPRTT